MVADVAAHLDTLDAVGVAEWVRSGEVSAAEVLEATGDRIAERDPILNAMVDIDLGRAQDGLARIYPDAPFAGVPLVVKDLGATVEGLRATRGSRLWADEVATEDSELVARYRRAGFVIVATTNSPEMGKSASTEPSLHGPTRNPLRLSHSPGGSSGGTAAAVAAGLVPIGHGNDGGGSIRVPSSACGLVGLKPSRGRVSAAPATTLLASPYLSRRP